MRRNAFRKKLIVGVEDGSFQKGATREALLAAVLLRGLEIENVRITKIMVDGLDATQKLAETLNGWVFDGALLAGVSFAGFNVIDPTVIHERFGKPVVVVTRTRPDNKSVKRALQRHFEDWKIRWAVFEKLGPAHSIIVLAGGSPVYVETIGVSTKWASNLIQALSICGRVPEPIRAARMIARGLS
jgi:endonuclease V-like protein UPF0215 family